MVTVKWSDLESAFEFVSAGSGDESRAFVSLQTGQIHWISDAIDPEDQEFPEDIDDSDLYKPLPNKKELDLGRKLVFSFVERHLPDEFDRVANMYMRQGAYRRFKDLLEHRGKLDTWRQFEHQATLQALTDWCAEHGVRVDPDA